MGRLWNWLGRVADGISLWQVVASFGAVGVLISWVATGYHAIAQQGWGAVVFAGIFVAAFLTLAATGSLALFRYFRPLPVTVSMTNPATAQTSAPIASPDQELSARLTADQLQFRVFLKQFALTWPANLHDAAGRVRAVVVNKLKQNGDRDYSYALFHAMHFAWSSGSKSLARVTELASAELEKIDVEALQHALQVYFDEYVWEQRAIANLNVLVKIDLAALPETQRWLEMDRNCSAELAKLTVWEEAKRIKKIGADEMANNTANWTTPFRVNF